MAKTTGYKLREAIRVREMERSVLEGQFEESLMQFKDDNKGDPKEIAKQLRQNEEAIATLQVAQDFYNLRVTVKVQGKEVSLAEAVAKIGGAGRIKDRWQAVANQGGSDRDRRYRHRLEARDPAQERASAKITPQDALKEAITAAKIAAALRAAIAEGNSTDLEIPDLEDKLLQ